MDHSGPVSPATPTSPPRKKLNMGPTPEEEEEERQRTARSALDLVSADNTDTVDVDDSDGSNEEDEPPPNSSQDNPILTEGTSTPRNLLAEVSTAPQLSGVSLTQHTLSLNSPQQGSLSETHGLPTGMSQGLNPSGALCRTKEYSFHPLPSGRSSVNYFEALLSETYGLWTWAGNPDGSVMRYLTISYRALAAYIERNQQGLLAFIIREAIIDSERVTGCSCKNVYLIFGGFPTLIGQQSHKDNTNCLRTSQTFFRGDHAGAHRKFYDSALTRIRNLFR